MSTKNLARTVIEGGRTRSNCWFRRFTNRTQRARQREALGQLALENDMDGLTVPRREPAYRSFADKLGPAGRWLERQAGRPWDAVRAELFERFDTRTTPGRHIVFCHMLPWVEEQSGGSRRARFAVDAHGILRSAVRPRPRYLRTLPSLPRPEQEILSWLAGRRVGERGGALFWFTPTDAGAYRQHQRLDDREATLWRSLPPCFRKQHAPSVPAPDGRKRH